MFLIIDEDNTITYIDEVPDDVLSQADDGIIDVINISGGFLTQYCGGHWLELSEYGEFYEI